MPRGALGGAIAFAKPALRLLRRIWRIKKKPAKKANTDPAATPAMRRKRGGGKQLHSSPQYQRRNSLPKKNATRAIVPRKTPNGI
jgi:hypothetical protein